MAVEHTTPENSKAIDTIRKGVIRGKTNFFRFARYGMTIYEARVVYYAILKSQLEKRPFEPVEMTVKEFLAISGTATHYAYSQLKKLTEGLVSRFVGYYFEDESGKKEISYVPWVQELKYKVNEGKVIIALNPVLRPFFEGKPFTQTEYYYLIKFTSRYSERLYEIVKAHDNKAMADFYVEDLRERFALDKDQYTNYADLKRRVLEPAIKDINKWTDLEISIEEKRGSRNKVTKVIFLITKKDVPKLAERIENGEFMDIKDSENWSEEDEKQLFDELVGDNNYVIGEDNQITLKGLINQDFEDSTNRIK